MRMWLLPAAGFKIREQVKRREKKLEPESESQEEYQMVWEVCEYEAPLLNIATSCSRRLPTSRFLFSTRLQSSSGKFNRFLTLFQLILTNKTLAICLDPCSIYHAKRSSQKRFTDTSSTRTSVSIRHSLNRIEMRRDIHDRNPGNFPDPPL